MNSSRTRLLRLAPVLVAPLLVSCVWLLDFDELQKETGNDDNGGSSSGGSAGGVLGGGGGLGAVGGLGATGGMAGAAECPSSCTDDDPCTLDGCTTDGECTREPLLGLALDGVDETVEADAHYRTTIASAGDAFFLSSFSLAGSTPEVTFYRLDANAPSDALSVIATLGGLNLADAVPLSAAGLAVDTALGRIHAFVGMQNLQNNLGPQLWHVVLDMNYEPISRLTIPNGYGSQLPSSYPVAANLGGDIAAAWINANQEVSLWTGALAGPAQLAAGRTPMTVSLLGTPEHQPLVLYGVDGGGLFIEGDGVPVAGVEECQVRPGGYLSSSATSVGIPGYWLSYWTKYGDASGTEGGFLTTDGRGLACSASGCSSGLAGECGNTLANAVRNVALASAVRPGDPTGLVHIVQVTPLIGTEAGSTQLYAGMLASASRVDFGRVPFETEAESTELGEPVVLGAMPTALPDLAGPDWPVVAYVPPDRFAIAWTQPSPSAGSELRIQRYRLCAPE